MEDLELNKRVEEEARKARARYRDRAAFAGSSPSSESACWIETVRPLVERIVELEQAPAKVDAAQGETLIKRVGREVGPALDRYQACEGGNHSSMAAAIGPLVAANMGLEDEREKLNREIYCLRSDLTEARAEFDGERFNVANLRDKLTAAQTAGRDQASEIERLRDERDSARAAMATEHIASKVEIERLKNERAHADAALTDASTDLTRERETVRKLLSDVAALETTIDVLAGRVAELTGRAGQ